MQSTRRPTPPGLAKTVPHKWILVWSIKEDKFINIRFNPDFKAWQWKKFPQVQPVPHYFVVTVFAKDESHAQALALALLRKEGWL